MRQGALKLSLFQAVDLQVVAPGGQGQDFLPPELLQKLLGRAHLDVHLDGEACGGDGLHPPELVHQLLAAHVGDVQGADGLLDPPSLLPLLAPLLPLPLLNLPEALLLGHISHHMLRRVTDKRDAAGP